MNPIIEINHLSFRYPDGKQALDDIHMCVLPGEKISLIGANGAGKSTLLHHLNGILTGNGGIRIDGMEMKKQNLGRIRALVGLVFQNPDDQLFSPTVFEDVAFGPIYQGFERNVISRKVEAALEAVNMGEYAGRNPYHLSSGEKKRIAIATVLAMQPKILVFDEPSSGLDPRARREFIELLQKMPQTQVIATHDLNLAQQLTSRTILLYQGKIVADGSSLEILEDQQLLFNFGLY